MGEPLLAAFLQTLLDKLDSRRLLKFARQEGFESELKKWRSKLRQFKRVLGDAEERQISDREVKKWLDNLRDLAYDADDVLEELDHKTLQRHNNSSSDSATSSGQVQDLLAQIQEITTRFVDIEEGKSDLGLEEKPRLRSSIINNSFPTSSLVDSSQIVGREGDIEAILKLLDISATTKAGANLNTVLGMGGWESGSINKHLKLKSTVGLTAPTSETLVIPIVGMGGVGKTTLAKCIYNHKTLESSFQLKAWICVSDNFDIIGVTKAILYQVADKDAIDVNDLNMLQVRLKEKIAGKRFLIVLDDVWNEDPGVWENFFIPLKEGSLGSVVIVTTRNCRVASIMGNTSSCPLNILKDDECVSIFAQHALGAKNFDKHQNLKVIGEKMVRRCGGLPLAARTLGGLLRNQDPMKWDEVYNSSVWNGSISEKIAPALQLSYHHLPYPLKQCFAYCSVFPKNYEFHEKELILLWMGEGFLGKPNAKKQMEELGHEYFQNLLSRSLLQRSSFKTTKFVMHDLIHDLAHIVAGRVCFRMDDWEVEDADTNVAAARHLSYLHSEYEPNKKFMVLKNTEGLRTLLALPIEDMDNHHFINKKLLHDLLPQLRYLRVLALSFYQIHELPSSISELKYLRYLNLSYTHIQVLPDSLCSLYSLQSLILKGCRYLQQLPLRLIDLINLRHLDIADTPKLQELPPHIVDLKFLRKLTKFVVGEDDALRLRELKKLHHLIGSLMISGLEKVKDIHDALMIDLKDKKNIEELELE